MCLNTLILCVRSLLWIDQCFWSDSHGPGTGTVCDMTLGLVSLSAVLGFLLVQKSIDRMPEMIPHSPALLASSLLKHDEHAILASISARIGSISDNRLGGWYSCALDDG